MAEYLEKTQSTGTEFLAALEETSQVVSSHRDRLSSDRVDRLQRAVEACERSAGRIDFTVGTIVAQTSLTVVDLESRMIQETQKLVEDAHALEKAALDDPDALSAVGPSLRYVEETLQNLACALFPSAAQGLTRANERVSRWEREQRPLIRNAVSELDADRRRDVETTLSRIERGFNGARSFLNDVALERFRGSTFREEHRNQIRALEEVRVVAESARSDPRHRGFGSILDRARELANDAIEAFGRLRVPFFPDHGDLEELRPLIAPELYLDLSGPQKFALLNIVSQMRSIANESDLSLIDATYQPNVWRVYTDRIYLKATDALLAQVESRKDFHQADAGLHRFHDGSYKQTTFDRGNLQLSFERHTDAPFDFDADIDLYRSPLAHFFGEVLVNHLTGSKTDQFRVREILDRRNVRPIGGFDIVAAG